MEKQNFKYLTKSSLPGSEILERDINEAFDFFTIDIEDETWRATFIKRDYEATVSENFLTTENENDSLSRAGSLKTNPFREFYHISGNGENNVEQVKTAEPGLGKT